MRVNGFAASHTHMFSSDADQRSALRPRAASTPTGCSRTATTRATCPARYGILGIPQVAGQRRPAGCCSADRTSSQLGHDGWVVSERFSNTLQFSDNLTKVYKSHTFKGGYMYQNIFFGSTQPPYARGEYYWDGRYTSLVNATDTSTGARALPARRRSRRSCRAASISSAA